MEQEIGVTEEKKRKRASGSLEFSDEEAVSDSSNPGEHGRGRRRRHVKRRENSLNRTNRMHREECLGDQGTSKDASNSNAPKHDAQVDIFVKTLTMDELPGDNVVGEIVSGSTVPLSALDQAMSKLYVRHYICYPYDNQDRDQTVSILHAGLQRTITSLPFLAGEVILAQGPKRGWVELKAGSGQDFKFIVKDFRGTNWTKSYAELDAQKMPNSELLDDLFAPCGFIPTSDDRAPVIAAQVNFIKGGLILCLCPHHSVLDAAGFGALWQLWAQNCRDISEPDNEKPRLRLTRDWVDKGRLLGVAPRRSGEGGLRDAMTERSSKRTYSGLVPQVRDLQPTKAVIFHFSTASLAKLKSDITSNEFFKEMDMAQSWISTNDALCALLWCCTIDVRHSRHVNEATTAAYPKSTLGIAINARNRMNPPLPPTFLGNMILYLKAKREMDTGTTPLLQAVAQASSEIRRHLRLIDEAEIRSVIADIEALPDLSELPKLFFPNNPETDLTISSWADIPLYTLDWGKAITSKAAYVRLPKGAVKRFCIILPRLPDGSLEVLLGTAKNDMECLEKHELFTQYATMRCVADDE